MKILPYLILIPSNRKENECTIAKIKTGFIILDRFQFQRPLFIIPNMFVI